MSYYHFNVIRRPYFEKYKDLKLLEIGVALSCCGDFRHYLDSD